EGGTDCHRKQRKEARVTPYAFRQPRSCFSCVIISLPVSEKVVGLLGDIPRRYSQPPSFLPSGPDFFWQPVITHAELQMYWVYPDLHWSTDYVISWFLFFPVSLLW
ncbi:unnamed protein product, partial [Discosporangium mesarthrocarpum]